jgi:DNA repair protein RadC
MPDANQVRVERYLRVLEPIRELDHFTADDVAVSIREVTPQFVTSVLKQLTDDGHLAIEKEGKVRSYRWQTHRSEFEPHLWVKKRFSTALTSSPEQDRPRERLLSQGAENLKTAELLAILIRSGRPGESAVAAGEKLAAAFSENLGKLKDHSQTELKRVATSVSQGVYCQIMAAIELGRRVETAILNRDFTEFKIDSTAAAISYCQRKFRRLAIDRCQEEFHIVTLNTKLFPIATHQITVGTLDASLVHPREIFKSAIRDSASAIILVHNHPSGDSTPSREDLAVTERLRKCADIVGIKILDHIVVGADNCTSITEWENR